jgi:two-component system cell cycle response regulator DivK
MTYLLRAFGHTVLHADNGLDSVALAGDRKPDLIICDVQLPGLDGLRVASLAPRGRLPWP